MLAQHAHLDKHPLEEQPSAQVATQDVQRARPQVELKSAQTACLNMD